MFFMDCCQGKMRSSDAVVANETFTSRHQYIRYRNNMVSLYSTYQAPSYENSVTFLAPALAEMSYWSMSFVPVMACKNDMHREVNYKKKCYQHEIRLISWPLCTEYNGTRFVLAKPLFFSVREILVGFTWQTL